MGIVHKFGAKVITLSKDKNGNVFRYDVRYIDLSDQIVKITSKGFGEALLDIALQHFYKHKKALENINTKQETEKK